MIDQIVFAVGGIVGAWVFARAVSRLTPTAQTRWFAGGLVIAAGVYVAFGLVLGGPPLGFEIAQLGVFSVVAWAGLRHGSWIIAAGWLAHAAWDSLHMLPSFSGHAPGWYVTACIAFDVALGGYIFYRRHHLPADSGPLAGTPKTLVQK